MVGAGSRARRLGSALVAACVCLALLSTALPASAAPPGDAAAAPVSASSLAATVTSLTTKVTQLESRASELDRQLKQATNVVANLSGTVGADALQASKLVAAAQRQALDLYVNGDPARQTFALATAVAQGDVNDVAWSLTLIQTTSGETLKLAREARKRASSADATLTEAISTKDRIALERTRLDGLLATARQSVTDAEIELQAYVHRLGPGTIAGMTTVAYDAYRAAETRVHTDQPACGLRWELLAAIGKTESNHAQGRLAANGDTSPPILGIPIGPDTDLGAIDTDPKVDHAVGPMQFIPQTWLRWGADANNDGVININNIYDESLAAGRYLCAAASGDTLFTKAGVIKAIWAYNPNEEYLRVVGGRFEALASDLAAGWFSAADLPTPGTPLDDATRRPVAAPQSEPAPAATVVRIYTPFTATGLAVAAVSPDALPALCGQSAVMSTRAGVYRCQAVTVDPANPTAPAVANGAVFEQCLAAPYDTGLLACTSDPEQAVTLVRTGTPAVPTVAPGPPYFLIVLTGGDRCRPISSAPATSGAAPVAPAQVVAAGSVAPSAAPANGAAFRPVAAAATTTTVAATTTTTTTTVAPTATTTTTTAGNPTTTATTVVTTPTTPTTVATPTTPTTPDTTPETTGPTTTTTLPPPVGTLPVPAAAASVYRCSSGAEIVGQPRPGGVVAGTASPAVGTSAPGAATTSATTGGSGGPSATVSVTWTATVAQAGVPSRTVAVLTLVG